MKTYIRLIYNSKGSKPSEVYKILKEHNFVPTVGEYDFVYDWGEDIEANIDEILNKLDSFHTALMEKDVIYEVTTSDPMYHIKEVGPNAHQSRSYGASMPSTRKPQPPKTHEQTAAKKCSNCGHEAAYVKLYDRWYCHTCKKYI